MARSHISHTPTLCSRASRVKGKVIRHMATGGQKVVGRGSGRYADAQEPPMCLVVHTAPTGTCPCHLTVSSWIQQKLHAAGHASVQLSLKIPPRAVQPCNGLAFLGLHLPSLPHIGSKSSSCDGDCCAQSPNGLITCDPAVHSLTSPGSKGDATELELTQGGLPKDLGWVRSLLGPGSGVGAVPCSHGGKNGPWFMYPTPHSLCLGLPRFSLENPTHSTF